MAFLKGDSNDDRKVTGAYLALQERLIPEFTKAYAASVPKMVWKTSIMYQCLIRRTLDVVDGLRAAWNAGNILTAITMGRSLIETGAVVWRLSDGAKDATEKKDAKALDWVVMNVGFGTRLDVAGEKKEYWKAKNILTVIDDMDRNIFGDKDPRLRATYDFLSEFVHPNGYGIRGLYSDAFPGEYRVEFGNVSKKREDILPNLRVALSMVWLAEMAASDLEKMLPRITEFVPK
jgi:hypothetical protein